MPSTASVPAAPFRARRRAGHPAPPVRGTPDSPHRAAAWAHPRTEATCERCPVPAARSPPICVADAVLALPARARRRGRPGGVASEPPHPAPCGVLRVRALRSSHPPVLRPQGTAEGGSVGRPVRPLRPWRPACGGRATGVAAEASRPPSPRDRGGRTGPHQPWRNWTCGRRRPPRLRRSVLSARRPCRPSVGRPWRPPPSSCRDADPAAHPACSCSSW